MSSSHACHRLFVMSTYAPSPLHHFSPSPMLFPESLFLSALAEPRPLARCSDGAGQSGGEGQGSCQSCGCGARPQGRRPAVAGALQGP
eukprot:8260324-Lingulodinium_polyedra.AAC.1